MLFLTFLMNFRILLNVELSNSKVIKSWKTVTNVKMVTNMKHYNVKSNVKSCYKYENFKYPNLRPIFSAARKNIFGKMVTLNKC